MLEILRKLGFPTVSASTQGPEIDNIISLVHWLMLILFVGWGIWTAISWLVGLFGQSTGFG